MKYLLLGLYFGYICALQVAGQTSYEVSFNHDNLTVYGTFIVPNDTGKFPTIIINSGSGANDRDGTIPMVGANVICLYPNLLNDTLRPYKQLSDALVDSGFAVLRYDKLEFTYPTPATLGTVTFHKVWLPVKSAIGYVKTRSDVDTTKIILLGHSEGAALIPFIAKGRSDIRALISIASPRTPLDSLLAYQLVLIADTCNGNISQAQMQANQVLNYFNVIRTNTWNGGTPSFGEAPASTWYDYISAIDSVSINYNLANLPTLFIGLQKDINVPLSELSRLQNEVTITDDFWILPELNHYMTTNTNPNVSVVLTDTIIYWLKQKIITTEVSVHNQPDVSMQVYPNPFSSELIVSSSTGNIFISVRNIFGQEILFEHHGDTYTNFIYKLPMHSYPPGIYLINIQANGQSFNKKLLKQ